MIPSISSARINIFFRWNKLQHCWKPVIFSWHIPETNCINNTLPTDSSAVGPSNLGNVISQLLLCKQINPDFHSEELCSITKDSQEIAKLLSEMQEYMPKQEAYLGKVESHFFHSCFDGIFMKLILSAFVFSPFTFRAQWSVKG